QIVELSVKQQIRESIGFAERCPCPRPGHYRLKATYQEVLTAEAPFEVPFRPERDMPRLIEMAQGSWPDRECPRFLFLALFPPGQPPLFVVYSPGQDDSPQKGREHATAIRRWWDQNRSQLRSEKGRFIKVQPKP